MKKIKPHWQILGALVLSTLAALILRSIDAQAEEGFIVGFVGTCKFVGTIFMNLLKMIIVPLIVSSVVAGIAGLGGMSGFGRLLGKTAGFYALTSLCAIIVGLVLVNVIAPGLGADGQPNMEIREAFETEEQQASEAVCAALLSLWYLRQAVQHCL